MLTKEEFYKNKKLVNILSGRAGASLPPSPLRTERASFQAFGSSNVILSFGGVLCGDRTDAPRQGYLECPSHPDFLV